MKYINKLTWLLVLGAGLMTASCSDSDDVDIPGGLSIDKGGDSHRSSGWYRTACHCCLTGLGGKYLLSLG